MIQMAVTEVYCPTCDSNKVVKMGLTSNGKQRFKCKNNNCTKISFILKYSYLGLMPEIKNKIIEMAMNGSGIRDTARVLKISASTVISEIKKIP